MSEPKHTRGPWEIEWPGEDTPNSGPMILAHGGKAVVAEVLQPVADEDGPYLGEFDARLIAAAPDLLAVCEALAKMHEPFPATRTDPPGRPLVALSVAQYEALVAAVAKAKGE